jgi:hypothetical protein
MSNDSRAYTGRIRPLNLIALIVAGLAVVPPALIQAEQFDDLTKIDWDKYLSGEVDEPYFTMELYYSAIPPSNTSYPTWNFITTTTSSNRVIHSHLPWFDDEATLPTTGAVQSYIPVLEFPYFPEDPLPGDSAPGSSLLLLDFSTTVPTPSAGAMLALASLTLYRRRAA